METDDRSSNFDIPKMQDWENYDDSEINHKILGVATRKKSNSGRVRSRSLSSSWEPLTMRWQASYDGSIHSPHHVAVSDLNPNLLLRPTEIPEKVASHYILTIQ